MTAIRTCLSSRWVAPALLASALVGVGVGCGGEPHSKLVTSAALAKKTVRVSAARELIRDSGDDVVGTVRARSVTAISASVMGTVRTLKVAVGSQVRAGDVLVQLTAGEIDAKLNQAKAVHARAELDYQRAEQLRASQSITTSQYDGAVAAVRIAEAGLAEAEVMRGYTTIRAPFAGVITEKHADVGDLALPGHPLLVLENPGTLRLEASVPEAVARTLHHGDRLRVRIDALPEPFEAQVSELSPSADPLSRTILVKLDLPQLEGLRAGMFGRMLVKTGELRTVGVDNAAIVRRGQLETLFVEQGGTARLRLVRVGRVDADVAEILAGIDVGERVVVSDASHVVDGQPLEVTP